MRKLILLLIVFSIIGCEETEYIPDNEITINALYYRNREQLPVQTKLYTLKVYLMHSVEPGTMGGYTTIYDGIVNTYDVVLTQQDLEFGRYCIYIERYDLTGSLEIIYKGGNIQLDIIMK